MSWFKKVKKCDYYDEIGITYNYKAEKFRNELMISGIWWKEIINPFFTVNFSFKFKTKDKFLVFL